MTNDIEATLSDLRSRVSAATTAQTRAQVQHEQAVQERKSALEALKEFGVGSAEEAAALLRSLEADLAAEIEKVKAALEEAGA